MDVTFRLAQQIHWAPASSASKASQDGTLATLSLRWQHVSHPDLVPYMVVYMAHLQRFASPVQQNHFMLTALQL